MDLQRVQHHLIEKLGALKEYLFLSESMRRSLNLREMDEVARWMNRRQELIGRIDQIEGDFGKELPEDSFPEIEGAEQVREEFQNLYTRIKEVLQTIKAVDEECEARIVSLKEEVRAELQKTFQGVMTVRNYTKSLNYPPALIDVRR